MPKRVREAHAGLVEPMDVAGIVGDVMVASLLHLVSKIVWAGPIALFWPIWTATTAAVALAASWAIADSERRDDASVVAPTIRRTFERRWTPGTAAAIALLVLLTALSIALALAWDDFANYDNSMFTLYTLNGRDLAPPIWRSNGRFFPLGHQEYNLIRHVTDTIAGYHLLRIAQLVTMVGVLLVLDEDIGIGTRAGLASLALVTPSILIAFGGLIYPDSNVVFFLVVLALCLKRFDRRPTIPWAITAIVSAQVMLYYKETAFVLLLGLAFARLVLRCRDARRLGWHWSRLREKASRLDLILVLLALLFLTYYVAAMLPHPNMRYAEDQSLPLLDVVTTYAKLDLLALIFVLVVAARALLILRRSVVPDVFWDALAFAGAMFFVAYLGLRIETAYYLAPVDLIALLYVGRLVIRSASGLKVPVRIAVASLSGIVLLQDLLLSSFRMYEQKNVVHAKVEIAQILERHRESGDRVQRLFFPFGKPYVVMEFAAYLAHRGFTIEGLPSRNPVGPRLVLVSGAVTSDGPCVDYQKIYCHAAAMPSAEDVVVVLPDDEASSAEAEVYRNRGKILLSISPYPNLGTSLRPLLQVLRIASPRFSQKPLPDRWLEAFVAGSTQE